MTRPRSKLLMALSLLLCATAAAASLAAAHAWNRTGERKMTQLLAGDSTVKLAGLEIRGQQRQVRCTQHDVLDYLTGAIRTQSERSLVGGVVYDATFTFAGGGKFTTTIDVLPGGFGLSMPDLALEETFPTHMVHLPAGPPPGPKALFDFLDEPWEKAAGTVLVLEDGKVPQTRRDASLVVRQHSVRCYWMSFQ